MLPPLRWIGFFLWISGLLFDPNTLFAQTSLGLQFETYDLDWVRVFSSPSIDPEKYGLKMLFDHDSKTAWCVKKRGALELDLKEGFRVDRIALMNGYQKSEPLYEANSRLKGFSLFQYNRNVSHLNGTTFDVADTFGKQQSFTLPDVSSEGVVGIVKFGLEPIKKGSKYQDLCLSELDLVPAVVADSKELPKNSNAASGNATDLLWRSVGKPVPLSQSDVSRLLSMPRMDLKKALATVFETYRCQKGGKIPSQAALLLSVLFPDMDLSQKARDIYSCEKKFNGGGLDPCEYFCAYQFVPEYVAVRSGKSTAPKFKPEFIPSIWGTPSQTELSEALATMKESDLIPSLKNRGLRKLPPVPPSAIEQGYRSAVYRELSIRGQEVAPVLGELLVAYGADASGDLVGSIQKVLLNMVQRTRQ